MKLLRSRSPQGLSAKLTHCAWSGLLITMLLAPAVAAQEWMGIAGLGVEVKSGKGGALPQATVTLLYQGVFDEEAIGGPAPRATDSKGRASFSNLALGTWSLRVEHPDHLSYVATVLLSRRDKPQVSSSFLEASGSGRKPIRVKLVKSQGRDLGTAMPVARKPPPPEPVVPLQQPEETPSEAPAEAAMDPKPGPEVPIEAPHQTPPEPEPETESPAPPRAPQEAPAVAPPRTPTETPVEPPMEAPAETPAKAPMPEPAEMPAPPPPMPAAPTPQEPADVPVERPAETPGEPAGVERAAAEPEVERKRPDIPAPPPQQPVPQPPPPQADLEPPAPAAPIQPAQPEPPRVVEPEPSPDLEPSAPEPTPAPAAETPQPDPQPESVALSSVLAGVPAGAVTSYRNRTCLECKPGEWGVASRVAAAGTPGGGCPADALDSAERSVEALAREFGHQLRDFAGPVLRSSQDPLLAGLPDETRGELDRSIGAFLRPDSSCRLLVLVFPQRVRISGFRFEATEGDRSSDCNGAEPCPIGSARWLANPGIERSGGATFTWALFENRSPDTERGARITGYFAAPGGWRPPGN